MAKNRKILVLFGLVVAGGLASLPWQVGQWKQLKLAREEREINERRLAALEQAKKGEKETLAQIQRNPTSPEAQLEQIRLLLSKQRIPEALDGLAAFEGQNASNPATWRALSDLYKEVGYTDKALFYAKKMRRVGAEVRRRADPARLSGADSRLANRRQEASRSGDRGQSRRPEPAAGDGALPPQRHRGGRPFRTHGL